MEWSLRIAVTMLIVFFVEIVGSDRSSQSIRLSVEYISFHLKIMFMQMLFLMMESLSKGKSGFLCVKCNKLKVGKESLQAEILFSCIKLAFSCIFQQEKQSVYPFSDVEMEHYFFQRMIT